MKQEMQPVTDTIESASALQSDWLIRFFIAGLCSVLILLLSFRSYAAPEVIRFEVFAGHEGQIGTNDGPALEARLDSPVGIATDKSGNVFVGSWFGTVRRISPEGLITTIAGKARERSFVDGASSEARFMDIGGLAIDSTGNIYATDFHNHAIRKITPDGGVSTFAGGSWGYADGTGREAQFVAPHGITVDKAGRILIADAWAENVRRITADGNVSTVAGKTNGPIEGHVYTVVDGVGTAARFFGPFSIASDSGGNLYVTDLDNRLIRKITPDATVTTLAGARMVSGTNDGPGLAARFHSPMALIVDASDNIFVAERFNGALRKITPEGTVTTIRLVDTRGQPFAFGSAEGMAIDASGNLYVSDTRRHVVYKGTPVVALEIQKASPTESVHLSFRAIKSGESIVEFRDALGSTDWAILESKNATAGETVSVVDSSSSTDQRFYRLRQP